MSYKNDLQNNNIDLQGILDMILALGLVDDPTYPEADTLDGCSWANISAIATAGKAQNYFAVGDCKRIVLDGTIGTLELSNYETYVYIIGFDHCGVTNIITFGTFKNALSDSTDICLVNDYSAYKTDGAKIFNMNHWGNYNHGGWKGCDLRYDILGSTNVAPSGYGSAVTTSRVGYDATSTCATNPVANTLMAALPFELRTVMKPMTVYTDNVGNSSTTASNVTASIDYLPLLAEFEIFDDIVSSNQYEQIYLQQYPYFSAGNSKVKYQHSSTSSTAIWWERSPYCLNDTNFCRVNTNGESTNSYLRLSYGLAPIFRV